MALDGALSGELARLAELRLVALELRVDADLQLGREGLVAELRGLVAEHPWRERFYAQLMLALYRTGRQTEALEVIRTARERLDTELGLRPSAELRELEQAILTHSGALAPAAARTRRLPTRLAMERGKPLVGRTAELDTTLRAWHEAEAGGRHVVFIAGEAGIGKTRLAAEAAAHVADAGHRVLFAACDETLTVPGRPLREALRPILTGVEGPYAGTIAAFAPGLGLEPAPRGDDPAEEQARLLDALVDLLRRATRTEPLLLVLDDVHWADDLTLLALRQFQRAEVLARVLVIATHRDTERPALLDQLRADAARRSDVSRIELGPLRVEDVAAIAGEDGPAAAALHAATDGNPFFVSQVLSATGSELVPAGVRDLVRVRLARLPAGTTRVLASAALLGREFRTDALLAAHPDRGEVLDALERAEAAQFVRPLGGGAFAFAHALVMRAVRDELPAMARMRAHERIALALVEAPAAERARHFREAAPLGHEREALRWSRAAGDEAMASLAFASAAEHYAVAVELADSPDLALRVAHGLALRLAGDPTAVAGLIDTAIEAERLGEFVLMSEALLAIHLAYASEYSADPQVAGLLRRALDGLPERDGPLRARLLSFLAQETLRVPRRREEPAALAAQARAMARRSGSAVAIGDALLASQWVEMHPATVAERGRWASELVDVASAHRLAFYECMGHTFAYMAAVERADGNAAAAALEAGASITSMLVSRFTIAFHHATWQALTAPLDVAEASALAARNAGRDAGIKESVLDDACGGQIVCIRMLQGRLAEFDGLITGLAAADILLPAWKAMLAWLRCSQGRHDEARAALTAALTPVMHSQSRHMQWSTAAVLAADVASTLGERAACAALYEVLLPYSGLITWSGGGSLGPFDLALGRLAEALDGRAEDHYRRAIAQCERLGTEGYLAIARHRLAGVAPGQRDELAALARAGAERTGVALSAVL